MIRPDTKDRHYFTLQEPQRTELLQREMDWSDNPIGLVTLYRTYLRKKEDGTLETWNDCVLRVIEGMFSFQKTHVVNSGLMWDEGRAQKTAFDAADRLFQFKWTPPGRGLWMMGTDFVWDRGGAALNNCAFVSTQNIDTEFSEPFRFLMDMSMLGVGCGFDTRGAGKVVVSRPEGDPEVFVVPDTREGWVESIGKLIDSYLIPGSRPTEQDVSLVRAYGEPIRGFGGVSSGPLPLTQGFAGIKDVLEKYVGLPLDSVGITDVQNIIGKIVVAGNVRRTAEIAFAEPNDKAFRTMKNWQINAVETGAVPPPELREASEEDYNEYANHMYDPVGEAIVEKYKHEPWAYKFGGWRWASNNSLFATVGMDYTEIAESIAGNGEPGLAWLDNMREYGRMKDGKNFKDIKALGGNPCWTGDTMLLTKERGYQPIGELVGESVSVWNGQEWSAVEPFSTGVNYLVRVTLTDGTVLRCTEYHEFLTIEGFDNDKQIRVKAADLTPGTKLQKWQMPVLQDGEDYCESPYSQGFYSGDGTRGRTSSRLYGEKKNCMPRLKGKLGPYYSDMDAHVWHHGPMLDKSFVPVNGSLSYCLEWLAGYLDADGTVTRDKNGNGLQAASIDHGFLADVRLMLSRMGVRAKVVAAMPAGVRSITNQLGTTGDYFCKETKRLLIGNQDTLALLNLGLTCTRLKLHDNPPQRDARQYVKVVSVEWLSEPEETFCVTEPKLHQMTVEGVVTGNCLEQTLESYELCTLVETYPSKHANAKEYYETLKIAYLYAKTVTLIATHNAKTNTVMCRNRRIGTSQSGIIDAVAKFGRHYYQKNVADIAYEKIEHYDDVYSDWLGVPKSIKKTSVKPSGSVSLLANVSPGIHYPKVRYGYRTMRLAKDSRLVPILRAANYKVETSISDPLRTVVVYFPIIGKEEVPCEADASIWEQFTNAVMMQKYWADNQVSITISFKPEEVKDIAKCLSTFDSELKGVSLLPLNDHGYKQAPYIAADKSEVVDYKKSLSPLDMSQMHALEEGDNAESNKFCDGESCMI